MTKSKRQQDLDARLEKNGGRVESQDKTISGTANKSGYEVHDTHLNGEEKHTTVIYNR